MATFCVSPVWNPLRGARHDRTALATHELFPVPLRTGGQGTAHLGRAPQFEVAVTPQNPGQVAGATIIIKTDYPVENRATYYAWARVR
jgi:hypothetical protein